MKPPLLALSTLAFIRCLPAVAGHSRAKRFGCGGRVAEILTEGNQENEDGLTLQ